jgi:two-component system, OmpR family, response regulator
MLDAPPKQKLLMVGFEPAHSEAFTRGLASLGLQTVAAANPVKAMQHLETGAIALVLLDLDAPDGSGLDLLQLIRRRSHIPIIVVGAAGQKQRRVAALDLGADDFIEKPADADILIAHARALLRRAQLAQFQVTDTAHSDIGASAPPQALLDDVVTFEGWRLDISGHRLWTPGNVLIELTAAECSLLAVFAKHARRTLSRPEIAALRGTSDDSSERAIDVAIKKLRAKLAEHRGGRALIKTARGAGYLFPAHVTPVA